MTKNLGSPIEIQPDEGWAAHLRALSADVVPPTAADPHAMSRVAIRRTRTRRVVLATGGGAVAVAAFAGAAFAFGGPTPGGVLLPGRSTSADSSTSASADPSKGADPSDPSRGADPSDPSKGADPSDESKGAEPSDPSRATGEVPAGWHTHELEGLTYSLPPEAVTSGPVQDEPGEVSDMWHSSEDPDAPPFFRIASYADGIATPAWPDSAPKPDAEDFDLPGAERATMADASAEAAGLPAGTEVPERSKGPVALTIERTDGEGAYYITLNLPHEGSKEFARQFKDSLTLD